MEESAELDVVGLPGTDATIAQHIQTIVDRKYVIERMQGATKYLVPSTLGIGLVEGYNEIGFDRSLSRPELRREVLAMAPIVLLELKHPILVADRTSDGTSLRRRENEDRHARGKCGEIQGHVYENEA